MTDETLRAALREAYTLLVSAEPTLIRDAKHAPNETSAHYKALLRDRVTQWLEPYRDNFDEAANALLAAQPASIEVGAHPGEPHEFRTICRRCGELGMLHVSLITPTERVDITDTRFTAEGSET